MKVSLMTIGCKLNQYETMVVEEGFSSRGATIVPFPDQADLYVINTCTVTAKADYRSRQAVRRALRVNPEAVVVATGCYAQIAPEELAAISGVDYVVGMRRKVDIPRLEMTKQPTPVIMVDEVDAATGLDLPAVKSFSGHTRAFVKVQDGCDAACSYCRVTLVRGPSRSLPLPAIEYQVATLLREGFLEVVLTGVNLGAWGRDLSPPSSLGCLLQSLEKLPGDFRIRLSSVEPTEFSPDLLDILKSASRLCPHFHLPLQSADPDLLSAMNRPYRPEDYRAVVEALTTIYPEAAIGADIMVGFPGETEAAFQKTLEFVSNPPLAYFHVFSYSPRPGTPAAARKGGVSPEEVKRRSRLLRALSARKRSEFACRFISRTIPVLQEDRRDQASGLARGVSHNYLTALFDAPPEWGGGLVSVRVTAAKGAVVFGETIGKPILPKTGHPAG